VTSSYGGVEGVGLLGEVGLSSDSRQLRYECRLEYAKRPALLFNKLVMRLTSRTVDM